MVIKQKPKFSINGAPYKKTSVIRILVKHGTTIQTYRHSILANSICSPTNIDYEKYLTTDITKTSTSMITVSFTLKPLDLSFKSLSSIKLVSPQSAGEAQNQLLTTRENGSKSLGHKIEHRVQKQISEDIQPFFPKNELSRRKLRQLNVRISYPTSITPYFPPFPLHIFLHLGRLAFILQIWHTKKIWRMSFTSLFTLSKSHSIHHIGFGTFIFL